MEIRMHIKNVITILAVMNSSLCLAQTEFDTSFMNGGKNVRSDFLDYSSSNVPGKYLVDFYLNNKSYGRHVLVIKDDDKESICLPLTLLETLDLPINYEKMIDAFNPTDHCYNLEKIPKASAIFDFSTQSLSLQLPQLILLEDNEYSWDYGANGFILNYNANASHHYYRDHGKDTSSAFVNFDLQMNYDRWVFTTQASGTNKTGIRSSEYLVSTAIKPIKSAFSIGKTYTRSSVLNDFSFVGLTLYSDSSMEPHKTRAYAPIIEGFADSSSTITIKQGKYILLSRDIPAGHYSFSNINPIGSKDIVVEVESDTGKITKKIYPMSTLPNLLAEGDYDYNIATGRKGDFDNYIKNPFIFASLDRGFRYATLNTAVVLHDKYQSLGIGAGVPLSYFGAISFNVNGSRSEYNKTDKSQKRSLEGINTSLRYVKDITERTHVQFVAYEYHSTGYVDFNGFDPDSYDEYGSESLRNRFETILTHSFDHSYLSASGWYSNYRGIIASEYGGNVSFSTAFENGVTASISGSITSSESLGEDYSTTLSLSIPLSYKERDIFTNSSVTYSKTSGTTVSTNTSFNSSDNISHSVSASASKSERSASFSTNANLNPVAIGFNASTSNNSTSVGGSISGSVAAAEGAGIAYSSRRSQTIAIVNTKGIDKAKVNGRKADNFGNIIIPLSTYTQNRINLNSKDISHDIELNKTSYNVIPTDKAIIVRKFDYKKVQRYLLRVFDKNGTELPLGSQVTTDDNVYVGFIATQGVLMATLDSPSHYLHIKTNTQTCNVDISKIKPDLNEVKDIYCQ
ncbi:hypothetical protein C9J45_21075 [Photobacterium sp. GB-1]|nr:hypothetical protein C9J45_21075 [Photobacterium sp. GB-1]